MNDKDLHFTVNFLMVIVLAFLFNFLFAIGFALIVSIGKELVDKYIRKTHFSMGDLVADILGIAVACLVYVIGR